MKIESVVVKSYPETLSLDTVFHALGAARLELFPLFFSPYQNNKIARNVEALADIQEVWTG